MRESCPKKRAFHRPLTIRKSLILVLDKVTAATYGAPTGIILILLKHLYVRGTHNAC